MGNADAYAVIGWGSLIWDLEVLTPHVSGPWQMGAGPQLSMEFTRVSPKRKMGLAVCLDAEHGALCPTHVIRSVRGDLADAVADLVARERAPLDGIGGVCLAKGTVQGRFADVVRAWCLSAGWKGAVWTNVTPNFAEARGEAFTIPRAMAYLSGLEGESRDEAVRYIDNAPAATDTPLRRALSAERWWQVEAARVRALDLAARRAGSG
ncbi:MAG: hypothetical protein AAFV19_13495 [Pseudomonadota bacterium]